MTLLELNLNVDRLADALERIAAVLEREFPVPEAPAQGESVLHRVTRIKPTRADEEWKNYAPPVRRDYGED